MVVEKYGKWKASFEITYDQHQEPCGALMYGKKCRKLCFPISIVRGTEKKTTDLGPLVLYSHQSKTVPISGCWLSLPL